LRTSAALALALVAFAGCGGDDEPAETTVPLPQLTVPGSDDTTQPAPTDTAPAAETQPPADDGSGGTPAPEPEDAPDGPENDTPPPEGSPAERFEEFCDANPGACG
jgi:hypothetical protein